MVRDRIVTVVWLLVLGWDAAATAADGGLENLLDRCIPRFSGTEMDMGQFGYRLHQTTGVPVGVILVTIPLDYWNKPMRPVSRITIDRSNVTARQLLDEAVQQAPDYVWRSTPGGTVNLLPAKEVEDPNSFINKTHASFVAKEQELSEVLRQVANSMRTADHPIKHARLSMTEVERLYPRELSFTVENGTGVDVLNAAMRAVGPDMFWVLNFDTLENTRIELSRVKSCELEKAEAYLLQSDKSRDEAVRLFEEAKKTAPYDAVAVFIDFRIAEVLASDGYGVAPDWNGAFERYLGVIRVAQPWLHCYPEVLEGLVAAANETNRSKEAADALTGWDDDAKRPPALSKEELVRHRRALGVANNWMGWAILGVVVVVGSMMGVLAASVVRRRPEADPSGTGTV
jgi:hypothetical protein